MAQICDRCGRKPQMANSRSKSNIATRRRQMINLQAKKINGVRMFLCTRCIKTISKQAV